MNYFTASQYVPAHRTWISWCIWECMAVDWGPLQWTVWIQITLSLWWFLFPMFWW